MAKIGIDIGLYLDAEGNLLITDKPAPEGATLLGPSQGFVLIAPLDEPVKAEVTMIVENIDVTIPAEQVEQKNAAHVQLKE